MAFKVEGEARVAFTNTPGQVPQPPDNGELKVQQADALLVTRKADGTARYTDLRPVVEQLDSGPLATTLNATPEKLAAGTDTKARPSIAEVPDVAYKTVLLGGVVLPAARTARERAADWCVSLLDWISDPQERAKIRAGTSTADHTTAVRRAVADTASLGVNLLIEGRYNVSDEISGFAQGQAMFGRHWFKDGLNVLPGFNLAATCVLKGNHYLTFSQFSISYPSPLLTSPPHTRATIGTNTAGYVDDRYRAVPALNMAFTQTRIDGLGIRNSMYGIRARGNCGAACWTDLRIGAFTKGIETDGALDFITGSGWRFWPYGYDGGAETFYYDGTTVGWDCAQVESVAVTDLNFFGANLVVRGGQFNPGTIPFGNVGSISLDGNCSRVIMQGGRLNVGVLYSTKDSGQAGYAGKSPDCFRSLVQTGGRLQIGLLDSVVNGGANDMEVNGGTLEVLGGTHQQINGGFRTLLVTGGYVRAGWTQQPNVSVGTSAQQRVPRSIEFIATSGTGVLNGKDLIFMPQRTGDSGNAIVFATDLDGNIAPSNSGGWPIVSTNGAQNTQLGPSFAPGTVFLPSINFDTPNGFVPVYSERYGKFWHTAYGIEFTLRLVVNMNNVGVASGRCFVGGLPALNGEATGRALTLGEWSGVAFDAPFTQLAAAYDDARKAPVLWECGRTSGVGPAAGQIVATNFVSNTTLVLNISGAIAKR